MSGRWDDYLDGWHELQADIEERDADLRDADFLAPKRRVPMDAPVTVGRRTPVELPHDRFPALPFRTARCRSCYRTDCDGGMECLGSSTWD